MLITPGAEQPGEAVLEQLLELEGPLLRLHTALTRGGPDLAGAYPDWAYQAETLLCRYGERRDVQWLMPFRRSEPLTAAPREDRLTPFAGGLRRRHAELRSAIGRLRAEITRSREASEAPLVLDTDVYLHALHEYAEIDLVVVSNRSGTGAPSRPDWPLHVFVPLIVLAAADATPGTGTAGG